MTITPESRAQAVHRLIEVHEFVDGGMMTYPTARDSVALIAAAIRDAENEAIERAAEASESETGVHTEDGEGDAWIALRITEKIRSLKSPSPPKEPT